MLMKNLENLKIIFDDYKLDIDDIIDIENLMCVSEITNNDYSMEYHIEYTTGDNCHILKYVYANATYSNYDRHLIDHEMTDEEFNIIKTMNMGFIMIENFDSENRRDNGYNGVCGYSMNRYNIGKSKYLRKTYFDKGVDVTLQYDIIKNRECILEKIGDFKDE